MDVGSEKNLQEWSADSCLTRGCKQHHHKTQGLAFSYAEVCFFERSGFRSVLEGRPQEK